jgi:hypothetical protein
MFPPNSSFGSKRWHGGTVASGQARDGREKSSLAPSHAARPKNPEIVAWALASTTAVLALYLRPSAAANKALVHRDRSAVLVSIARDLAPRRPPPPSGSQAVRPVGRTAVARPVSFFSRPPFKRQTKGVTSCPVVLPPADCCISRLPITFHTILPPVSVAVPPRPDPKLTSPQYPSSCKDTGMLSCSSCVYIV